jgi:hypothetical protein
MHYNLIQERVSQQGFGREEISRAVDQLFNEGHIYTTIDDFHFQYAS